MRCLYRQSASILSANLIKTNASGQNYSWFLLGINRLGVKSPSRHFIFVFMRHSMIRNTDKRKLSNTHIHSYCTTYGSSFIIWNSAQTFLTHQDRIYNSNFQYAGLDIDLSIGVGCLSDLSWITEACVNSRYTGADCNISSLPGRLASINSPIHQAAVLPLTRVSEADEGNKWWREGINQRKGGEAPAPWLVQSSPEMEHDGGARLRCKEGVAALCLGVLG